MTTATDAVLSAAEKLIDVVQKDGLTTTLTTRNRSVTIEGDAAPPVAGLPRNVFPDAEEPDPVEPDEGKEFAGRQLIIGGDPDAPAPIPSAKDFENAGEEFLADLRLDRIATALQERHNLSALEVKTHFRWKDAGGDSNGQATLGKCEKLSGAKRHFAKGDYLIWLAADHCRDAGFTAWELEALLFHELLHIEVEEDKKGEQKRKIRGHDAELFTAEFRHYGAWTMDLKQVKRAVEQMPMDLA